MSLTPPDTNMAHIDQEPWKVEDLFPHLDRFIRSTRIVTVGDANRTWVRVWPSVGFCANQEARELLPPGTCLRRPLRPDQAWDAFLESSEANEELLAPLRDLQPPSGPTTAYDLLGGDYLLDDPETEIFLLHMDRYRQAKATVLDYLDTALQALNREIVDTLGIESWADEAEALLRRLGLDACDLPTRDHDQLTSAIAAHWHLIDPYMQDVASDLARISGPAMLYLIAMCSACAARAGHRTITQSMMHGQSWVAAMLDEPQAFPQVRLKQAVSATGTTQPVIRSAWRLGGESVRILAGNTDPCLAFERCIRGLQLLCEVGPPFGEAFLREIEAAEPRWRRLPAWILHRAAVHALSRHRTGDYEELLATELSCVVDALEYDEIDLDLLPDNIRWPGIVSHASHMQWESNLPAYCDNGYEVWPLLTSIELQEEGRAMQNCAKEYDLLCKGEIARVFSIRDAGSARRVATAAIMREESAGRWRLNEVKGPRNKPAPIDVESVASRIAAVHTLNGTGTTSMDRLVMPGQTAAPITGISVIGQ